jgi:hypothetical protein
MYVCMYVCMYVAPSSRETLLESAKISVKLTTFITRLIYMYVFVYYESMFSGGCWHESIAGSRNDLLMPAILRACYRGCVQDKRSPAPN